MWLFNRHLAPEVLRIGRLGVERWSAGASHLSLLESVPLAITDPTDDHGVALAIRSCFQGQRPSRVALVFESAWVPLCLLDLGSNALLPKADVESMMKHRLEDMYGNGDPDAVQWMVRIEYRPGERFVLGYGFPAGLHVALMRLEKELGIRWSAFAPALAWGLERTNTNRSRNASNGWWVWPEQDRAVIAKLSKNRIVALNASAGLVATPAEIKRQVDTEVVRAGQQAIDEPICVATWGPRPSSPAMDQDVRWFALCASSPQPTRASHEAVHIGIES